MLQQEAVALCPGKASWDKGPLHLPAFLPGPHLRRGSEVVENQRFSFGY